MHDNNFEVGTQVLKIYASDLGKTWEKLMVVARVTVATENPVGIIVQSTRPYRQMGILKLDHYFFAQPLAGRLTLGVSTLRRIQRLLIFTAHRTDHQIHKYNMLVSVYQLNAGQDGSMNVLHHSPRTYM